MSDARNYNHPYKPYDIQKQLMDAIYDTINSGYKIGLFESPTGTGKTLSLICASMTWLRDYKRGDTGAEEVKDGKASTINPMFSDSEDEDEPQWVKNAYEQSKSRLEQQSSIARDYEHHLDEIAKKWQGKIQKTYELPDKQIKKRRRDKEVDLSTEYLPEDYYSDSELNEAIDIGAANELLSKEVKALLNKVDGPKDDIRPTNECPVHIYFSSRTHSQLNQLAHQLQLTSFKSSISNSEERTKFLPLASRKQLCIHPTISKSKDITTLNEKCLDLQKSKDKSQKCEFMPKMNDPKFEESKRDFTDLSFTKVHDIEDLVLFGKELCICPYYSVRDGVQMSEMIALPYQMLLQESTRDTLNLKIDNSIIIIDEAHNLLDVISAINSVSIRQTELQQIIKSLKLYLNKFSRRLNSGNRVNLMKLIKLCQIIGDFIQNTSKIIPGQEISMDSIFKDSNGDSVNIYKLEKFLQRSKIAYKIESYNEVIEENLGNDSRKSTTSTPLLFKITSFLKCLMNPSKEGRLYWEKIDGTVSINYTLLDPSELFRDIVSRAKCVILCGGTMEPMSDYIDYLFPYVPKNQIKKFSCGHIVPDENLQVFPIAGFQNSTFEFSFDKRNNESMLKNLGLAILKIMQTIKKGGIIIFFPSYKYLDQVVEHWKQLGIYRDMQNLNKIFTEPTNSTDVEKVLSEYGNTISKFNVAALFSVVGGKMSEGINFSDDLARAVIMIGLPFPNAFSGELVAKRKFIESSVTERGGTKQQAMEAARNFYENICMRAVNQSVGRSIRHIGDYSIIYLLDIRYGSSRIQNKLSGWVNRRIFSKNSCVTLENALEETKKFFMGKV